MTVPLSDRIEAFIAHPTHYSASETVELVEEMRRELHGDGERPAWRAVEYALDPGEPGDMESLTWGVTASWRGPGDAWALIPGCYMHGGSTCFDRDGERTWEIRGGDDEWRAQHRFTLEEALELGKKFLPTMVVNGMTWAQVVAWRAGGHQRDENGRPIIPGGAS